MQQQTSEQSYAFFKWSNDIEEVSNSKNVMLGDNYELAKKEVEFMVSKSKNKLVKLNNIRRDMIVDFERKSAYKLCLKRKGFQDI